MKKLLTFALAIIIMLSISGTALADLPLKPVADPWDDPANLIEDGNIYYTCNDAGYVVVWETPACELDGQYLLLDNNTGVLVDYQVKYMDEIPWGRVSVTTTDAETGESTEFIGWVLMTDLRFKDGTPAFELPLVVPPHPMIPDPIPVPTEEPEETEAIESPAVTTVPQRPDEAITVSNTYNNAIVYSSIAIAVGALALVAYVLIKHKALNKKGE
ncbi:MAG: hypothetical protein Q4A83_08005 [Bacillota bacterium]|nr:hypothetical protein [Bacillota bacterium]